MSETAEVPEISLPSKPIEDRGHVWERAHEEGKKAFGLVEQLRTRGITEIGLNLNINDYKAPGKLFIADGENKLSGLRADLSYTRDEIHKKAKRVLALLEYREKPEPLPNNPSYKVTDADWEAIHASRKPRCLVLVRDPEIQDVHGEGLLEVREAIFQEENVTPELAERVDPRWKKETKITTLKLVESGSPLSSVAIRDMEKLGYVLDAVNNLPSASVAKV